MNPARRWRLAILLLLLACSVGCDQAAKQVARSELPGRSVIDFPGGFGRFQLAENPGSFLSLGDSLPGWARKWLFTIGTGIGLAALLAYLTLSARLAWPNFLGLALMVAGGLSNLIDRILRDGLVTDFIYLSAGPLHTGIFNLADTMILAGGAIVVVASFRAKPAPAA